MKTIKSIRKKTIVNLALLVVITMTMSCSEESLTIDNSVAPEATLITADLTASMITTFASFDPFSDEFPESIAVDHFGNIYVSMTDLQEIWKLDPEGSFEKVVASFPLDEGLFGVVGIRFDARGNLYAGVHSLDADVHGFYKISPNGEKERIPGSGDIVGINDVAISPNGTVYMTDSGGSVWRYTGSGQAEIWVQDETLVGTGDYGFPFKIGANGIVVVPGRKMPFARSSGEKSVGGLLVSNAEKGQLVYIPILTDGSAGEPFVVISDPTLFGLDGITLDPQGNIYGAVNVGYSVVRISKDGTTITEIAKEGLLDFPTGLAFGTGTERHTLFVVNAAFFGPLENANPAVISISIDPGQ